MTAEERKRIVLEAVPENVRECVTDGDCECRHPMNRCTGCMCRDSARRALALAIPEGSVVVKKADLRGIERFNGICPACHREIRREEPEHATDCWLAAALGDE